MRITLRTMTIMVSKKVCDDVFQIIEALQKQSPLKPITQKQVHAKTNLTLRHVRRAFRKLCKDQLIIRHGRGQYWLPKYFESINEYAIEELKRNQEIERKFWENTVELTSKKLMEMRRKMYEQERLYEQIIEQYERQEILKELEKKELRADK